MTRSTAAPRLGDFIVPIDSVAVTPNPAATGETLSVRLFSAMNGSCVPWTITTSGTGYRTDITVWGRNGVAPSPCRELHDQVIRIPLNLPGGHEYYTVAAHQPGCTPLEIEVPVSRVPSRTRRSP